MGERKRSKGRRTGEQSVRQIANLFMLCCEARISADRGKRYRKTTKIDDLTVVVEAGRGRGVVVRMLDEDEKKD